MCRLMPTSRSGHNSTARMAESMGVSAFKCAKYPCPDATIRPTTIQMMVTIDEPVRLMFNLLTARRAIGCPDPQSRCRRLLGQVGAVLRETRAQHGEPPSLRGCAYGK